MSAQQQTVIRELVIRGSSQGVDKLASDLNRLDQAQEAVARSAGTMGQVSETSARRQTSAVNDLERLRRTVDEVHRSQARYAEVETRLARAAGQGLVDMRERDRLLGLAAQKYGVAAQANENFARSSGLAAHQVGNLRSQLFDVVASLQGGQNPFTVLSQQGPQIYEALAGQGGIAAGLKQAGQSALGLINPTTALVGSVAAVGAAAIASAAAWDRYETQQRDVERSVAGIGRATGATRDSINQTALATAAAGSVSISAARSMQAEYARTGKVGGAMFGDLVRVARDYAVTTGQDLEQANTDLARAFADPTKGAEQLNARLGFLSGTTLDAIRRQQAMGDTLGAQRTLYAALVPSLLKVTEQTSAWAQAWDAVKNSASNAADAIGRALAQPTLQERAAQLQQRLRSNDTSTEPDLVEALRAMGLDDPQIRAQVPSYRTMTPRQVEQTTQDLSDVQEQRRRQSALAMQREIDQLNRDASTRALGVLDRMFPGGRELDELAGDAAAFGRALKDATNLPDIERARAGLAQIEEKLKAGGTAAYELRKAAQDAFDAAGLLPYERGLAQIEQKYRDLAKAAGGDQRIIGGLNVAKGLEQATFRREQIDVPLRDAATRINEQVSALRVQRDGFTLSTEAAAAMAARQELVNDLTRRGITDLSDYSARLDQLAAAAGKAAAAQEELRRVQQNVVGGMDELRSSTSGLLTGAFSDVRQGKSPLEGIVNSLGRQTDQMFDRLISRPLTEGLLGQFGKPGGGATGDWISRIFGDASGIKLPNPLAQSTTASMTVNAASVVVNGGIGTGGLPGIGGSGQNLIPGASQILDSSKFGGGASASYSEVAGYIRQAAAMRGIDPDIALRVARSEGLTQSNPTGTIGDQGRSFGPWQLFTGGGLGNTALSRGINVRDPSTWRQQTDFALDQARSGGWGPWYGARNSGIGNWEGITRSTEQATQSLSTLSSSATEATSGLGSFGSGLDAFGSKLSQVAIGSGGGGGFGLGNLFGSLFGGGGGSAPFIDAAGASWSANGNVLTPDGPMPLRYMAKGGIAQAGQPFVNIIGEGQMNEAVVPLPDGRSIPVSMNVPMPVNTGGGGGAPITINQAPINVQPAQGYTPEQILAAIRQGNEETVRHIQRNFGNMGRVWDRRFG
ncbi:phage tail length tape measure family protein [Enterovirga aerilata]|uniref:Bacteriophage tail tape measure N-terminal domain-containing protein n=1 Tax=Enterovirga aerilata TaxID=2730920 RepID=A0A849I5P7_9HYPH|nr:phage tail length tape measure family protein [Enterovirga sp. DB1703]NNM71420.1 hypothetical protein [Enterovirga sp. DB1703]